MIKSLTREFQLRTDRFITCFETKRLIRHDEAFLFDGVLKCFKNYFSLDRKNSAVYPFPLFVISSGVPVNIRLPPRFSPPSGPRSIIQSAHLMISRLCS